MKNFCVAVVVFLVLLGLAYAGAYSSLNHANQEALRCMGDIESTQQRRMDLVPSLVNTVKGYAAHERQLFTEVAQARAKAGQVNIKDAAVDAQMMRQFVEAQSELSAALGRLLAVVESNPEPKAAALFANLQAQLEGTENRCNVARERYNASAAALNVRVNGIITGWVARQNGFHEMQYFKAGPEAAAVPKVEF